MKHIAFTGGGSGGHVTPIASLIEYGLQDTDIVSQCKLFRFGELGSMEQSFADQYKESVLFLHIAAGKRRRYWGWHALLGNLQDLCRLVKGIVESWKLLRIHKIDIVFCKGGYVALPVCLASRLSHIPIVVHESDTYGGLTNRVVAMMAKVVFTGFPDTLRRGVCLGQLLSPHLLHPSLSFVCKLDVKKCVVLVMGGSQGASALFSWLEHVLKLKTFPNVHFLVLLGTKNSNFANLFTDYEHVTTYSFLSDPKEMAAVYQVTDISITRGSATSLAEQQAFGIKKCIVPTPFTGGNHQWHNGIWYQKNFGDICIEQKEGFEKQLTQSLLSLLPYKKSPTHPDVAMIIGPLRNVRNTLLGKNK